MDRRKFILNTTTVLASLHFSGDALASGNKYKALRFGIFTDIHYAEKAPLNNRYFQEALGKTEECVTFMNQQKVEFLLENGDLKDAGETAEDTLRYLDTVEAVMQNLMGLHIMFWAITMQIISLKPSF